MNIKDKIYVATIAEDAQAMAEKYGVGIEINEFCTAANMDENFTEWDQKVRQELNVTQPTLSHHMKILCDSGIVTGRKEGKWMHYSISEDGAKAAADLLKELTTVAGGSEDKPCCKK